MKKTSILIHYTHKQTLGHTTRVLTIANELTRHFGTRINLTIMQGGLPQPFIKFPPSVRMINIPVPFDSRASFKGITNQSLIAARARFVLETVRRIHPDVLVTEFFPFGRIEYADELLPALKYLHSDGARIYASIGYPHVANIMNKGQPQSLNLILQIINLYDRLLIHTPEGLENPYFLKTFSSDDLRAQYTDFFRSISCKISYTGYIRPSPTAKIMANAALLQKKKGQWTVIVSRGGGAVYPKIIANAIQAQHILGNDYRFLISSGPATSDAEKRLFHSLLKKKPKANIVLLEYIPDLSSLLKCADVTVSMCGYNTSTQLLSARPASIIIPYVNDFVNISSNEQLARSLLLHDHIQSTVLFYPDLNATILARAIQARCNNQRPRAVPQQWFSGNNKTAQYIVTGK